MPHSIGASFIEWLQRQWQTVTPWQIVLWPCSWLFALLVALRRAAYQWGFLKSLGLPIPVIVVGNLTVGGTGKTPLVLWLVHFLRRQGFRPAIISRGYGGRVHRPHAVSAQSDPALVGDEPVLLAQRASCPVWVGTDRVEVARALLSARPDCDVLISDDGLQHYRMRRDVEIVVVDGQRGFGNKRMLPAGPLREPMSRLESVDAVVMHGGSVKSGQYAMRLVGNVFVNLRDRQRTAEASMFKGRHLHAVAGIGFPARFFDQLRQLGLSIVAHPFPDHHVYRPHELQFEDADAILMTEKDGVKCIAFAPENAWMLVVDAEVDPALGDKVLEKLRKRDGRKIA
ncbi:MAG: tetraacyldisaccharide 4'-kinase [Methylophilaceae bacterium]|nr:tetraacyldisaccharide 4'-kinase [Methylophilaceae bacterium]